MIFYKKFIKFVLLIIFILPNTSFSSELECACISFNATGSITKGSKTENYPDKKCPDINPIILIDYDEGFMSITFQNNSKTYDLEILKDEKAYISGIHKEDKKNFIKVHLNKKKKIVRVTRESYLYNPPLSIPKLNIYNEAFTSINKYKLKVQCK